MSIRERLRFVVLHILCNFAQVFSYKQLIKHKNMKIKDAVIVITGGASGIGRIMGRRALEMGAKSVAVWDINQENLDTVVAEHAALGTARGYRVDVSDYEAVKAAYAATVADLGAVDILINNAGIVTTNATFDRNTATDIERTIRINTIAPMYVAQVMLPDMISRDRGHICNIASAAGLLALPKMSVYTASKWATMGWSDSVWIELKQMKSHVRITTFAPYFINTGMFDGVRSWFFPILDPEKTAARILRSIERGTRFKGVPFSFRFARFMQGLMPMWLTDWTFGELFGIYHVMDHFTGRK